MPELTLSAEFQSKLEHCPGQPGVYLMKGAKGEVLYAWSTTSDRTGSGTPPRYAHTANAATGSAARTVSPGDEGSGATATTATTTAKAGTSALSWSVWDDSRPGPCDTPRPYCGAAISASSRSRRRSFRPRSEPRSAQSRITYVRPQRSPKRCRYSDVSIPISAMT